jgi:hypothetical protein
LERCLVRFPESAKLILIALLMALLLPVEAHGDQPSGPRALWTSYPLKPAQAAAVAEAAEAVPAVAPRRAAALHASPESDFPVLILLAGAVVLAAGAVALRRAPALATAAPLPTRHGDWPDEAKYRWRAEVVWAGGWRASRFRVLAAPPGSHRRTTIATTKPFEGVIMRSPDPTRLRFRAPFEELVSELQRDGWRPVRSGSQWWNVRFVWTRPGAPV